MKSSTMRAGNATMKGLSQDLNSNNPKILKRCKANMSLELTQNALLNSSQTYIQNSPRLFHSIRTLVHTPLKWVPHVIPLDYIPKLYASFDLMKRMPTLGSPKTNEWSEFIIKRNKVMFATQYLLALRPGEMVHIKFTDIWKNPQGQWSIFIRGETNKRKRDRELPVPESLKDIWTHFFSRFNYNIYWNNSHYIFPSYMNRDKPITRYQWNEIFQRAIRLAGLWRPHPKRPTRGLYTAHSLRHSRAVHLLEESNHDLWLVANTLGHSRLDVTACYLHACESINVYQRKIMQSDILSLD